MAKKKVESAPEKLTGTEQLKLWVRSGGRCAYCKKYLLADRFSTYEYNFGEMAHNVGRQRSAGSPRGLEPLPIEDRNKAENVLLLCHDHHKMIDAKVTQKEFSVADLTKIKKDHEDQIFYLSGLTKDQATTVIRTVGNIRGGTVELSPEHVRKAVLANGRFPGFPLQLVGADCEIDLRAIPDEGTPGYWAAGQQAIGDALRYRLDDGVRKGHIRHISLFAITRIPLLVSLGYLLDDKIPVELYQKHRDGEEGWLWKDDDKPTEFEQVQLQVGTDPAKVAVILNLSGTIQMNELPEQMGNSFTVIAIQPVGEAPNRNVIRNKQSLKNFTGAYHALLSDLERDNKAAREIHLFPAIPLTAAVECGRGLMRNVQPTIKVYDRNGVNEFEFALEVNRP